MKYEDNPPPMNPVMVISIFTFVMTFLLILNISQNTKHDLSLKIQTNSIPQIGMLITNKAEK